MPGMSEYTVGEVARWSHVSVRTLHHYVEIGLLAPSGRSDVGCRLYSDDDLARLGRILFYRELDFGLEEIGRAGRHDGGVTHRTALTTGISTPTTRGSAPCTTIRPRPCAGSSTATRSRRRS